MLKIKIMNNLIECSRCNKEKTPDMFISRKTGKQCKTCLECREKVMKSTFKIKCPHNRQKSKCKDCGGVSICIHNKQKYLCRDCKGGGICIHNRKKTRCKECKGGGICIHNRQKIRCKECGGNGICIHNDYKSSCKDCNPKGHLRHIVRCRIRRALKSKKSKGSLEYLGCNMEFYKTHIEKQFTEGMTWDNMGEWEIDHIIPLAYENPTMEEVIERLHWSNTQPLWKVDNMKKGNRWIG